MDYLVLRQAARKVCIVSSCGGHLTEVRQLKPIYTQFDHFYVLNDNALLAEDMIDKTLFITHSERDWKFFINLWQAFKILKKHRPHLLLSTGAGLIVPFTLVARFIFGIKTIYIETFGCIDKPSLTGKIMYHLSDFFYYQQINQQPFFPKGIHIGPLFE